MDGNRDTSSWDDDHYWRGVQAGRDLLADFFEGDPTRTPDDLLAYLDTLEDDDRSELGESRHDPRTRRRPGDDIPGQASEALTG
jgi:hypothetical protein